MFPQHLSMSEQYYTPSHIVKAVRMTMGGIDLDPASERLANNWIGASKYYSKEQGGLQQDWKGKVFLNPPGGKIGGKSQAKLFWDKLSKEWVDGSVTEAIFIAFSVELLQTTQDLDYPAMLFPFCIPKKRIQFIDIQGKEKKSPTHANAIIYLPEKNLNFSKSIQDFQYYFQDIGMISDVCKFEENSNIFHPF